MSQTPTSIKAQQNGAYNLNQSHPSAGKTPVIKGVLPRTASTRQTAVSSTSASSGGAESPKPLIITMTDEKEQRRSKEGSTVAIVPHEGLVMPESGPYHQFLAKRDSNKSSTHRGGTVNSTKAEDDHDDGTDSKVTPAAQPAAMNPATVIAPANHIQSNAQNEPPRVTQRLSYGGASPHSSSSLSQTPVSLVESSSSPMRPTAGSSARTSTEHDAQSAGYQSRSASAVSSASQEGGAHAPPGKGLAPSMLPPFSFQFPNNSHSSSGNTAAMMMPPSPQPHYHQQQLYFHNPAGAHHSPMMMGLPCPAHPQSLPVPKMHMHDGIDTTHSALYGPSVRVGHPTAASPQQQFHTHSQSHTQQNQHHQHTANTGTMSSNKDGNNGANRVCKQWRMSGSCSFGSRCLYHHYDDQKGTSPAVSQRQIVAAHNYQHGQNTAAGWNFQMPPRAPHPQPRPLHSVNSNFGSDYSHQAPPPMMGTPTNANHMMGRYHPHQQHRQHFTPWMPAQYYHPSYSQSMISNATAAQPRPPPPMIPYFDELVTEEMPSSFSSPWYVFRSPDGQNVFYPSTSFGTGAGGQHQYQQGQGKHQVALRG